MKLSELISKGIDKATDRKIRNSVKKSSASRSKKTNAVPYAAIPVDKKTRQRKLKKRKDEIKSTELLNEQLSVPTTRETDLFFAEKKSSPAEIIRDDQEDELTISLADVLEEQKKFRKNKVHSSDDTPDVFESSDKPLIHQNKTIPDPESLSESALTIPLSDYIAEIRKEELPEEITALSSDPALTAKEIKSGEILQDSSIAITEDPEENSDSDVVSIAADIEKFPDNDIIPNAEDPEEISDNGVIPFDEDIKKNPDIEVFATAVDKNISDHLEIKENIPEGSGPIEPDQPDDLQDFNFRTVTEAKKFSITKMREDFRQIKPKELFKKKDIRCAGIITLVCLIVLIFSIATAKKTVGPEDFSLSAAERSLTVTDITAEYEALIGSVSSSQTAVSEAGWTADFDVYTNGDIAKQMYQESIKTAETYKTDPCIEMNETDHNKTSYTLVSNGYYFYVSKIDNTVLSIAATDVTRMNAELLIKSLGY